MEDEVLKEFRPIGKYRIRLVRTQWGDALDIREFVNTDYFKGFTRRGVRIKESEIQTFAGIFNELKEGGEASECIACGEQYREVEDGRNYLVPFCPGCRALRRDEGESPNMSTVDVKAAPRKGGSMEEVTRRMVCGLCAKEILKASGFDADNLPLCGKCSEVRIRAIQRTCRHETWAEGGITCTDCGFKQKSMKRVVWAVARGTKTVVVGIAKLAAMYWLPAMLGSAATMAVLYFIGKKFGLL